MIEFLPPPKPDQFLEEYQQAMLSIQTEIESLLNLPPEYFFEDSDAGRAECFDEMTKAGWKLDLITGKYRMA